MQGYFITAEGIIHKFNDKETMDDIIGVQDFGSLLNDGWIGIRTLSKIHVEFTSPSKEAFATLGNLVKQPFYVHEKYAIPRRFESVLELAHALRAEHTLS